MADRIRDEQLMRLQRALRTVEARLPDAVQKAKQDAAGLVVTEARRHAPRGPHQGGGTVIPVSAAIHTESGGRRVAIVFGGAQSPHGPPLEFGGTLRRYRSSKRTRVQARPHVYAAIASEGGPMLAAFERAVLDLVRDL